MVTSASAAYHQALQYTKAELIPLQMVQLKFHLVTCCCFQAFVK